MVMFWGPSREGPFLCSLGKYVHNHTSTPTCIQRLCCSLSEFPSQIGAIDQNTQCKMSRVMCVMMSWNFKESEWLKQIQTQSSTYILFICIRIDFFSGSILSMDLKDAMI